MPLGNLTSQFFANVYLNELDWFVKRELKAKCYIRYVDDFVILHNKKGVLQEYLGRINTFLYQNLFLELHLGKSKIYKLGSSLNFLGFRAFYHHKLLEKSNLRKLRVKIDTLKHEYKAKKIGYDIIYDFLEGWIAYAKYANTHKFRNKTTRKFECMFPNEISTKEINRYLST